MDRASMSIRVNVNTWLAKVPLGQDIGTEDKANE